MHIKPALLFLCSVPFYCSHLYTVIVMADVITDGSMGAHTELTGPNFVIPAELGTDAGANLFHSFSEFDLNKEQTATFITDPITENIIARVTDQDASVIDGRITTSNNTNLYLTNPNGLIFGPNTQLDVAGSFHASTASHIYLGDQGVFPSHLAEAPLLSSAPPSAFGFLSAQTGDISLVGSHLTVGEAQTLSLTAANIHLSNAALLQAKSGTIYLTSVNQADKINTHHAKIIYSDNAQKGHILLEENSTLDVGTQGGGGIFINAETVTLDNSDIIANTQTAATGGTIRITATDLTLKNNANIDSRTLSTGQGGTIEFIISGKLILQDSDIFTTTGSKEKSAGHAGDITIQADCLIMTNSTVSTDTFGKGNGGDIIIQTRSDMTLETHDKENSLFPTVTEIRASSRTGSTGHAGRIEISSQNITLKGSETRIDNNTRGTGQGGSIKLNVQDTLRLEEGASIAAESKSTGHAGSIDIEGQRVVLNNGTISTAALKSDGGNIWVYVTDSLLMQSSSITANVSGGQGNGGNISIANPHHFSLIDSKIIANASLGHGGVILLFTQNPINNKGSLIDASSEEGVDGNVEVNLPSLNFTPLPSNFLDASELIRQRCVARTDDSMSSFIVVGRGSLPNLPADLHSISPIDE